MSTSALHLYTSLAKCSHMTDRRPKQPRIDALLMVDRDVDLLTPMLTPGTYEGILSELFMVHGCCVSLPTELFHGRPSMKVVARNARTTEQGLAVGRTTSTPIAHASGSGAGAGAGAGAGDGGAGGGGGGDGSALHSTEAMRAADLSHSPGGAALHTIKLRGRDDIYKAVRSRSYVQLGI